MNILKQYPKFSLFLATGSFIIYKEFKEVKEIKEFKEVKEEEFYTKEELSILKDKRKHENIYPNLTKYVKDV